MVVKGHIIHRRISAKQFKDLLNDYTPKKVFCTDHTFFRLNEKQTKLFKCKDIINMLFEQRPTFVGIQKNKNFAVYYKTEMNSITKIIFDIQFERIDVVTFFKLTGKDLPRIRK